MSWVSGRVGSLSVFRANNNLTNPETFVLMLGTTLSVGGLLHHQEFKFGNDKYYS